MLEKIVVAPAERAKRGYPQSHRLGTAAARQLAPPGVVTTVNLEIDPVLAGAADEVFAEVSTR